MIHKSRQACIALLTLLLTLIIAACDKPEAKPPTNIEKEDGDEATPALYSFAFDVEEGLKVAFTAGTYTRAVIEKNKPDDDKRDITYTSSETRIATVDDTGKVNFVTQGTVTIKATRAAEGGHVKATASYILYITMKPANKATLVAEITRAMDTHGNKADLNYIDTSDITDMSYLFSGHARNGYGRGEFNGDISEWNVGKVTNMNSMFQDATAFNGDISKWNVGKVANMNSMFQDATAFNQDISRWDVTNVRDMQGMFLRATVFIQNLDAWGNRINNAVKANRWNHAFIIFRGSGLANKLPSWCQNTNCRNQQG